MEEGSQSAVKLSEELLAAVKVGNPSDDLESTLASLPESAMEAGLPDQASRLVFWINLYNAFFQVHVKRHPELAGSKLKLYTRRYFTVAGQRLSLDDIEHGMLRKSQLKLALGYLRNPFPGAFERRFRVLERDARIHFALNCGAKSCPPIYFYSIDEVDEQLELATKSFLSQEARYDDSTQTLHTTMLFRFYAGDFGSRPGIKQFHLKYGIIPDTQVQIKWNRYDWDLHLDNYS